MFAVLQLFGYILIASSSDFDFDFPIQHGMAVVKHIKSRTDNQLLTTMPESFDIQLDLLDDDDEPIILHLKKNDEKLDTKPIYIMEEDSYGVPTVMRDAVAIEQNIALYQCEDTLASFTVRCEGLEYGLCKPHILGSINFNGSDFDIKPNDAPESTVYDKDELYNVYPRKLHESHGKDCLTGEDQDNAAISNSLHQTDAVGQTEYEHFAMRNSFRMAQGAGHSSYDKRLPMTDNFAESAGASRTYSVGLLIAVDDIIYQRFYSKSKGYTHAEKEANAKVAIRQYYAHTVNAMDVRYRNIKHPNYEIRIVVTGYLIDDNVMVNIWDGMHESSVEDAMFRAIEWRKRFISQLPRHDHLMVFTGRDLFSKFTRDYSVTGFASLDSICRRDSISIIEDKGGFDCIITATHELGHSLGARHDGDRNICSPHDKYVMTSIGGDVTTHTKLNPFKFSECSKSYFLDRLQTLSNQGYNCLTVRKSHYDSREYTGYTTVATGQLFDPNRQCRMKLGDDSYYGWGGNLGEFKGVCTHMACKSNKSATSYNLYNAVRGTSCGYHKWCIDGECVYDPEAPAKDETCVHGDSRRSFAAYQSCADMVASDPSKCTDAYYRQFCCESCKHYQVNTIILTGVDRNRPGSNVMSIPVQHHVQRTLPNRYSSRGMHAAPMSPVYVQKPRPNTMPVTNHISHDKRFRILPASRPNNLPSTYDNQILSPHYTQQLNAIRSQQPYQSQGNHVFLPDHQRSNTLTPASPSISTAELASFRSLILRTLQLLARTTGSQYSAHTNTYNSDNNVDTSPFKFHHMRNVHRDVFENFGTGSVSSVPDSPSNTTESQIENSTAPTDMLETKSTLKPNNKADVSGNIEQSIAPSKPDSEPKKVNSNLAPMLEGPSTSGLILQSPTVSVHKEKLSPTGPRRTIVNKLKSTTRPVTNTMRVTGTGSTSKDTPTTTPASQTRTTVITKINNAAKLLKSTFESNIKMNIVKDKTISKGKGRISGLFDSSVGNIIDPFL